MSFTLHPRLAAGSHYLGRLGACHLLLKNNAVFPWFLLVPETEVEDLHELDEATYEQVTREIRAVSLFVAEYFPHEKLNVASIGNQVRQMHIHIVARSLEDPAWPGTVWAWEGKREYDPAAVQAIRKAALAGLPLKA